MAIVNTTELDLRLAAAFYPVLVQMAREGQGGPATQVNYDLLRQYTKLERPDLADDIDACTNQLVGRRLEFVRRFTDAKGYPDITALVVNKHLGEVGRGYEGDPAAARTAIAAFDWDNVEEEFDLYVANLQKTIKRRRVMKPAEAKRLVVAYAQANNIKTTDPKVRDRLIALVSEGMSVEGAFQVLTE